MSSLRAMPPGPPELRRRPASEGAASRLTDYLERNRAAWERWARDYLIPGREAWTDSELKWGIWRTPESDLGLLAGLPRGSDVVELGCGTASVSAWLARAGMRPVAVDFARAQLDLADRLQREFGPRFSLVRANAEEVPFESDSFDVCVSEYGASLWCDPRRWLPEAHRLLRPEGRLVFFVNGAMLMACTPADGDRAGDRLVRDYFSNPAVEFPEDDVVEFHLTHSGWVRILRETGFVLEDLVEVRPPYGARTDFPFVSVEWARRWPSEEVWIARKTG